MLTLAYKHQSFNIILHPRGKLHSLSALVLFELLLPSCQFEPVWPVSSDINKAFSPRGLLLTGHVFIFRPLPVNPRVGCVGKSTVSEILRPNSSRTPWSLKRLTKYSPFFHYSVTQWSLRQIICQNVSSLANQVKITSLKFNSSTRIGKKGD